MLTQIRNIRKTILQTQMPLTILKTCVSISSMKRPHITLAPSFPPHPSTHPSQAVSLKHSRRSQLRLNLTPSWWWFRYRDRCRLCLHLAPQCSRDQHYHASQTQHNRSMHTIKLRYLSHSLKPGCEQTCCDWRSAPPTWSSTNMFQLMFVNSFLCSFLTNQFYSTLCKYFKAFVF